jgi:pyridoxamine 5'-phosphate oxidase
MFYWDVLGRQVRIGGPVQRTSREESVAYIRSRPRGSQVSALASPQSQVVASRDALEQRVAALAATYSEADPPLPEAWGGFRVVPEVFEFWQHREDRLHDRLRYTPLGGGGWRLERLAP